MMLGKVRTTESMLQTTDKEQPPYLTTREVAELLRVKERKVYDLAAAGEIPHRRITGKLLFPAGEILAWIEAGGEAAGPDLPAVVAGSHDPLLDWAVREAETGLATLLNGSLDGLALFASRRAAVAGLHVPEDGGWNVETVSARGLRGAVLITWAMRSRGLLIRPSMAGEVRAFADLAGRRVILRQPGAGAAALFDDLLTKSGMSARDVVAVDGVARTESDAAAAVSAGEADAALGIEAMARQFHLAFVPLREERFDLLVDRRAYFTEPLQKLFAFARSAAFRAKADVLGGYDVRETGSVRWLSS